MKRKLEEFLPLNGVSVGSELAASPVHDAALVKVSYHRLPPESKKVLDRLVRQWADWHAEHYPTGSSTAVAQLLSGSVALEPELQQLGQSTCAVIDERPAPPGKSASSIMWFNIAYEKVGDVPLYDRGVDTPLHYTSPKKKRSARWKPLAHELAVLPLEGEDAMGAEVAAGGGAGAGGNGAGGGGASAAAAGGGAGGEAGLPAKRARAALRCFNCGSYAHSMRDCWREFNREAVEASKKEFADAREARGPGGRVAKRYFLGGIDITAGVAARGQGADGQPLPSVEFADVQPGKLSEDMRVALGLGPLDPPPWLARMKAMGPPPGYKVRASRRKALEEGVAGAGAAGVGAAVAEAGAEAAENGQRSGAAGSVPATVKNLGQEARAAPEVGAAAVAQQQSAVAEAGAAARQLETTAGPGAGVARSNGELARGDSGSLESGELPEAGNLGDLVEFVGVDCSSTAKDTTAAAGGGGSAAAGGAAEAGLAGAAAGGGEFGSTAVEGPSQGGEGRNHSPAAIVAVLAPAPEPLPLEDFIPFGEEEEDEGVAGTEGEAAHGEPGWEECWVYAAQFPGVNAPILEGADPAKWAAAGGAATAPDLPPGFSGGRDGGGRPHLPHRSLSQPAQLGGSSGTPQHHSAPRLSRFHSQHQAHQPLVGLHPPARSESTPVFGRDQQPSPVAGQAQHYGYAAPLHAQLTPQQQQQQQQAQQPPWQGQGMQLQYNTPQQYGPPQQAQQQQQYSPIVAQQQPQPQLFVASSEDPGHLVPMQAQQVFASTNQPFHQQQQPHMPMFAFGQVQQEQQQHAPLYAGGQHAQQAQAFSGGQQMFAAQQQQQQQQHPAPPGFYGQHQQQMW